MSVEYVGFHGSNYENIESITNENFRASQKEDEWLGYGVYFFVDGISDPVESAIEWARNESYKNGRHLYKNYVVFRSKVSCERVLDVTSTKGLIAFNKMREFLIEKNNKDFKYNRNLRHDDRVMWNLVAQTMKLDAVVHNLYIKNEVQRIKKIRSNVPNCTVMCVKVPTSIRRELTEVVCKGEVK